MNRVKSFFRQHKLLVIFFADLVAITLAVYLSFILRFDGTIPESLHSGLLLFTVAALVITPVAFAVFRLYSLPFSFISLTDLPNIMKGVLASVLALGTGLFLLRNAPPFEAFPRSIIFIYTILLFLFIVVLRFSKRIYWQIVRGNPEVFRIGNKEIALPLTRSFLNGKKPDTVLVTGGAGYIGSALVGELLKNGFKVKVYDKMLFGRESLALFASSPKLEIVEGDILDIRSLERAMVGVDAVVHTAAIVGEAACAAQKDTALRTNYLGAVNMAKLSKAYGVKHFIFFSTCSTYGKSDDIDEVDEHSPLRPVDFYGETKVYAERDILRLTDNTFDPTIFRLSTVYGLSSRMRFDLVVNIFARKAVEEGKITVFGGDQWRPLIHVKDVARAVVAALEAPLSKVGGRVFNVGGNEENYLIETLGELAKEIFPNLKAEVLETVTDQRSYKVKFKRIKQVLGFMPTYTVRDGMKEIKEALEEGAFSDTGDKRYHNHLVQ